VLKLMRASTEASNPLRSATQSSENSTPALTAPTVECGVSDSWRYNSTTFAPRVRLICFSVNRYLRHARFAVVGTKVQLGCFIKSDLVQIAF